MKLATLKAGGRDGTLVVVDRTLARAVTVPDIAPTLQAALDDWKHIAPRLEQVSTDLHGGRLESQSLDMEALAAPLPRAYQWLDGSAYLTHVERVRRARNAKMPPGFRTDPLMYQGMSDGFLGARDPIHVADISWGADFEAEVAVITDDVPEGIDLEAEAHICLLMLVNDVSLRRLIPEELSKGFGFLQGKPASSCSPVAVTPDELGSAWHDAKVHLELTVHLNNDLFGHPNAGEDMQFSYAELIAHAARTRRLGAGTIIGAGTVSNVDLTRGYACVLERRLVERVETGESSTHFLRYGDRVHIAMLDREGHSIFGAIDQTVEPWSG